MNFSRNLALWVIIALLVFALFNLFQGSSTRAPQSGLAFSDFLTSVESGEILLGIRVPAKWAGAMQYFEKVADRNVWDFALVNIAMAARMDGGTIADVSVVCGAVQCTPRRLGDVEDLMRGESPGSDLEALAKRVAASGAQPLNFNHFKIPMMQNLAARAVRSLG